MRSWALQLFIRGIRNRKADRGPFRSLPYCFAGFGSGSADCGSDSGSGFDSADSGFGSETDSGTDFWTCSGSAGSGFGF